MESDMVLNSALSIISLLLVATTVAFILRKSKMPYTVALLLVGIGLGYLGENFAGLAFLEDFRLSPELVFYVFLPTLIFESAFHTNLKHFTRNAKSIVALSTIGMLISTALVGAGLHYLINLPWGVSLLFGTLISATDPISVLALFKNVGAPKRLSVLIEGESLFNDGMALVLFGIVLEVVSQQGGLDRSLLLGGFSNFGIVVLGGIFIGLLMGFVFSKALDYVKDSKEIEISITLILAHSTFIIAEYFFEVSGILATVAAGIVIGNYGAYKISSSVKEIMGHFWDYSAFIANSLLFLLVGLIIYTTKDAITPLLLPTLIAIIVVLVARMIMVYTIMPTMNWLFPKERIPMSWVHVLQWSGLRGALAIALILTLPEDFQYYEELLIFTVGVIFFTVIFNGLTINPLLHFLGLKKFTAVESFERDENHVLITQHVNKKLDQMLKKKFISKDVYEQVKTSYDDFCKQCNDHVHELYMAHKDELTKKELQLILKRHLLGIEKRSFTKLYYIGEITQELLNVLLRNVNRQLERAKLDEVVRLGKLTTVDHNSPYARFLERIGVKDYRKRLKRKELMLRYEMFRARLIAISDVLEALEDIKGTGLFENKALIKEFEEKYKLWHKKAKEKLKGLEKVDPDACAEIQLYLARQAAFRAEDKALDLLKRIGVASPKVYNSLRKELIERREKCTLSA